MILIHGVRIPDGTVTFKFAQLESILVVVVSCAGNMPGISESQYRPRSLVKYLGISRHWHNSDSAN